MQSQSSLAPAYSSHCGTGAKDSPRKPNEIPVGRARESSPVDDSQCDGAETDDMYYTNPPKASTASGTIRLPLSEMESAMDCLNDRFSCGVDELSNRIKEIHGGLCHLL